MHQKQPIIFDRLLLRDLLKCDRACSMIRITYQVGGKRMKLHLSKSKYCNAVQCPKMLWMQLNHPELFDDSVMNQTILENGNEVGDLARGLFGDYTIVEFGEYPDMLNRTQELLNNGTANASDIRIALDDKMVHNCLYLSQEDPYAYYTFVQNNSSLQYSFRYRDKMSGSMSSSIFTPPFIIDDTNYIDDANYKKKN